MKPLHRQFLQFAGVGAISTLVHYAILVALVHRLAVGSTEASTVGFMAGALTNYMLNYHYTFASNKRHQETITKFLIVAMIGLFLNGFLMSSGVHWLQLHYLISQMIATCLVLLWNFTANHQWTFYEEKNSAEDTMGKK